jgi:hypothetical protein
VQYRDVHISTCLIKTLVIHLYCARASYLFVIVTRYLFIFASLFVIVIHSFCLLFDYLFVLRSDFIFQRFFAFIHCSPFKRENNNSDPELCSGISIMRTRYLFNIINTSQETSYSRLNRLCLSIGAKDLLPP